ncbi:Hypothetical predicted protein [Cloeon dipterum]|uniref:Uncharacterized protein n=2 Tax=Cloeon dipterum TaxID=197152 RepID=A0A8S1CDI1_9INSE|nr:Hypothetical predicted protein [Cloeon dipterum]CAB3388598.1 Hypothetical predicted protein [Cloeon dipterum]
MSLPRVWQSPLQGHQVPMQPSSGALNVTPYLNSSPPTTAQFSGHINQHARPGSQPHPTMQCSQPPMVQPALGQGSVDGNRGQNFDLASIIQNLTEAFQTNMNFMRNEMHRIIADSKQREERYEQQLNELRGELHYMRECFEEQSHTAQRQSSMIPPMHPNFFPRPQWSKNKKFWPKIEKSDDTPATNNYLDCSNELNKALESGSSLAIPGARCSFVEHVGNLWEAKEEVKVHAVGSDLSLGVGVALDCVKYAGRPDFEPNSAAVGDILKQDSDQVKGTIWHLVTKEKSSYKLYKKPEPFVLNVQRAFKKLAEEIEKEGIEELAMSYLCSGSDRMNRVWVMNQLYSELKDLNVTVHFYNKVQSKRWLGCGQLFAASGTSVNVNVPPDQDIPEVAPKKTVSPSLN